MEKNSVTFGDQMLLCVNHALNPITDSIIWRVNIAKHVVIVSKQLGCYKGVQTVLHPYFIRMLW